MFIVCFATALYAGDGSIVRHGKSVPGSYIVVLADKQTVPANIAVEFGRTHGIKPVHIYGLALNGFSFNGTDAAAHAISADVRVKRVEEDVVIVADAMSQPAKSWGLDRIDQRSLPLDHTYAWEYTGYGTVIYIVDSGVNPVSDLAGRIRERVNFVPDAAGNVNRNTNVDDCNGHGTGVATLAAGYEWGVAKQAQV